MSESTTVLNDFATSSAMLESNSAFLITTIKEEQDDMLMMSQSELLNGTGDDHKFQTLHSLEVPPNLEFNIPDLDEKQAGQGLTKYPIDLGDICKFDNGIKQEQVTHYVKYKLQDNKPSKVWECGICTKEFGHQYTLMRHLPTHTDERKFRCNTCGKAFRQMSTLSQHRAIHSIDRPYVCEMCPKTFNRVSTLISHRKTHTGTKPHRCHLCNKAFHQKGNLRNHIFTHTNERPYKCDMCSKGFNQMSNLMCHKVKAHQRCDKPHYTCRICGKDFEKRAGLRNHEQYQHGVQHSDPSTSALSDVKYANGVLVEPINTAAMQHALTTNQTPFALLRPLNGIPVLVRVLAAGDKQMLVPASAEDLKNHGLITISRQLDQSAKKDEENFDPLDSDNRGGRRVNAAANEATINSLGSTVQIKIPIVATVVQHCGKDGNMCMEIESPGPTSDGTVSDNYVLTSSTNDNIAVAQNLDYTDYGNFNLSTFVENNQILTSTEVQYVDDAGNILNFDQYKATTNALLDEEFHFDPQVNVLPPSMQLENNVINFSSNLQDLNCNDVININYVEGVNNSLFEVLAIVTGLTSVALPLRCDV